MDADRFVNEIEAKEFYKGIAETLKIRLDTSGCSKDNNRPLPIGKKKKIIDRMKEKMGGEILTFVCSFES